MAKTQKTYAPEFKMKVAVEMLREEKTAAEIASEYGVAQSLAFKWRKELLDNGSRVFSAKADAREEKRKEEKVAAERDEMLKTIGQLTLERDYLQRFCDHYGYTPKQA